MNTASLDAILELTRSARETLRRFQEQTDGPRLKADLEPVAAALDDACARLSRIVADGDADAPAPAAMSAERAWLELGVIAGRLALSQFGDGAERLEANIGAVNELNAMRVQLRHLPRLHQAIGEIAAKLARSHGGDSAERLAASVVAAREMHALSLEPNITAAAPVR